MLEASPRFDTQPTRSLDVVVYNPGLRLNGQGLHARLELQCRRYSAEWTSSKLGQSGRLLTGTAKEWGTSHRGW